MLYAIILLFILVGFNLWLTIMSISESETPKVETEKDIDKKSDIVADMMKKAREEEEKQRWKNLQEENRQLKEELEMYKHFVRGLKCSQDGFTSSNKET